MNRRNFFSRFQRPQKKVRREDVRPGLLEKLNIHKRQRFVITVLILSTILFYSRHQFGGTGIEIALLLGVLSDLFLWLANYKDLKGNFTFIIFILPFFYSVAIALFYFLVPDRMLSRIFITVLYAVGLYSLLLAQNIFTVASIRTIALLSSARIVSFVVTILSYLFLTNVIFSFKLPIFITPFLILIYSFFIILHTLWTITLEKSVKQYIVWAFCLSLCLFESALVLGFWPSDPTLLAIFQTGLFYIVVGTSQAWLEKRLFRGVLLGYIWVGVVFLFALIVFTSWGVSS